LGYWLQSIARWTLFDFSHRAIVVHSVAIVYLIADRADFLPSTKPCAGIPVWGFVVAVVWRRGKLPNSKNP
jgi:hypothetical protein